MLNNIQKVRTRVIPFSWQIREETDTKIELPSEGSDSDVIVITGHKAQVEAARDRIVAIQNELVRLSQSST